MVDKFVISPTWGVTQQAGCCGIGCVSRLASSSCTLSQKNAGVRSWLGLKEPKPLLSDLPNWRSGTLKQMLGFLNKRPQGVGWLGRKQCTRWYGGAVLPSLAFMAVIEDMLTNYRYSIYFFSDNTEGVGDVHNGPFSTRNFIKWLRDEDMGAIHSSGPVTSLRTSRELQSWIFVPNILRCEKQMKLVKDEFIQQVNKVNDNDKIKDAERDRRKDAELASKAIRNSLSSDWGRFEYTNTTAPTG